MDFKAYLFEGERILWAGKPSGIPLGWWIGLTLYLSIFAAGFGFPFHGFLVHGTEDLSVTINGQPLDSSMPRATVWTTIWVLTGVALAIFAVMLVFTWRRLAQRYALTSTKLIIASGTPFRSVHTVLLKSVIKHHTRHRGGLKTTVVEFNPPKSLIHRLYGIGRMAIHDYRDPPGGLGTLLDQTIADACKAG